MKVAVITKRNMSENEKRKSVIEFLRLQQDIQLEICEDSAHISENCDRVLVFGGDGTMLDAVGRTAELQIPVLGINVGNLGFLAECEPETDNQKIYDALTSGKVVDKMLICTAVGDSQCRKALNEVVVKSESARPIYVDLYVDGNYVDTYHSDGVIISTPTGSTAYSLSAGGPVLAPDVDAFTVLPICPHSLHSRPLVVSANSGIRLSMRGKESAYINVDGNCIRSVDSGDNIFVSRADKNAKFVTFGDDGFYKKLFQKMNRWGTTQQN